jgi:D-alanyl-D-alanine carboxypeptidase
LTTAMLSGCGAPEGPVDVENEPAPLVQGTVDDAVMNSCSTGAVLGLSNQIVDQVNCLRPNTLAAIPTRPNLTRSANTFAFMQPQGRDALVRALDANTGMTLGINSMLRTVAQQFLLYSWYRAARCSISLAAVPGGSNHESGLALDTSQYSAWQTALEAEAFSWLGTSDPVHFDYEGSGTVDLRPIGVRSFQRLWNVNNPSDLIAEDGIYGPDTETRLRRSPADGFAMPVPCPTAPDAGTADAADSGSADRGAPAVDANRTDARGADAVPERRVEAGSTAEAGRDDARYADAVPPTDVTEPPGTQPDGGQGGGTGGHEDLADASCSCRTVVEPGAATRRGAWPVALGLVGLTRLFVFRRRGKRRAAVGRP